MSAKIYLLEGAPVALGDSGALFIYNLLPVGKFYDRRYGEVWISDDMLSKMEKNFGKYPAYEVPIKIGHGDAAESPGKVIAIAAKPEGLEITFTTDKDAAQAINNKRFRYMSAEFDENYLDKTTGEYVGPVLLGAALVNQPADPYVQPLVLSDVLNKTREENKKMDPKELETLKKQLSEDFEKRDKEARTEFSEALKQEKERITQLEAQLKIAADEKARLTNEKREAEVKAFCDGWTNKGIPPAVVDKVKPLLLAGEGVIKLSDSESKPMITLLGEVFEAMPKVEMKQTGSADTPDKNLSDVEKAKARAERMAASVNPKKGE